MIGDSVCDIGAGRRAGTRTALIGPQPLAEVTPDVHRVTIADALSQVLGTLEPTVETNLMATCLSSPQRQRAFPPGAR